MASRYRNKEKDKITSRQWRQRNAKIISEKKKAARRANPEKTIAQYRAWRNKRKEQRLIEGRNRRAAKKNCVVYLTNKEKQAILLLEKTRKELQKETGRKYHIDHIIPICFGGLNHPINLRILEESENVSKQHKIIPEAVSLAPEHYRLYRDRISEERAWEFVCQLAKGLGLDRDDIHNLKTGKPLKTKPTLEDFLT